jgi:hypothetical protein
LKDADLISQPLGDESGQTHFSVTRPGNGAFAAFVVNVVLDAGHVDDFVLPVLFDLAGGSDHPGAEIAHLAATGIVIVQQEDVAPLPVSTFTAVRVLVTMLPF